MLVIDHALFDLFETRQRGDYMTRLHSVLVPLSSRIDGGISAPMLDRIVTMATDRGFKTEAEVAAFGVLWLILDVVCGAAGALDAMLGRMEQAGRAFTIFDVYDHVVAAL